MHKSRHPRVVTGDGLLADQHALLQQHREKRIIRSRNMANLEVAKLLKVELDALGGNLTRLSLKNGRSAPWMSKKLSLLTLKEQAMRLINEDISADEQVIRDVRYIEKVNPVLARQVVDELDATRGKFDARTLVAEIRSGVKAQQRLAANYERRRAETYRR